MLLVRCSSKREIYDTLYFAQSMDMEFLFPNLVDIGYALFVHKSLVPKTNISEANGSWHKKTMVI